MILYCCTHHWHHILSHLARVVGQTVKTEVPQFKQFKTKWSKFPKWPMRLQVTAKSSGSVHLLSFQQPNQPHRLGAGPTHKLSQQYEGSGKCTELMAMKEVMTNTWEVINFQIGVLDRMRSMNNWWNQTETEENEKTDSPKLIQLPRVYMFCDFSNTSATSESHQKPRHTKAIEFHRHTDQPQPVEKTPGLEHASGPVIAIKTLTFSIWVIYIYSIVGVLLFPIDQNDLHQTRPKKHQWFCGSPDAQVPASRVELPMPWCLLSLLKKGSMSTIIATFATVLSGHYLNY